MKPLASGRYGSAPFLLFSVCVFVLNGVVARAQSPTGTGRLTGVLKDTSGAIVPGGTVEIHALDQVRSRSARTDGEGRYAFQGLPPGRYTILATAPGLDPVVRPEIIVLADSDAVWDVTLPVARALVVVEVTAAAGAMPLAMETDPRTPRQPVPAHDGADYLKTIPGFSVIRKGGTDGDPVLRGMAGSRLGVLLDGENIYGGCGNRMDPPTAYAFPEAYDRITVLKGPQSVAHGPGNSAGVVLFERNRDVAPGVHVYASPTFGMFGRNDQVADFKAGWSRFYARTAATRSSMNDYEDGRGEPVHSQYTRWSTDGALGWTPDDATRLEVSGALSDGEAAYADRLMDGTTFSRQNVGVRFERQRVSRVVQNLEARAFYNYVDHIMDNYSLRPFAPSMTMPGRSVSNPDRRTVGGRVATSLLFSGSTAATLGADWQGNDHTVRSSSNQAIDPYQGHARVSDASFENLGLYGELTQALGQSQRLVAGGRVDWWSGRDERSTVFVGMGSTSPNPTAGMHRTEALGSGFGRYERELGNPAVTFYAGIGRTARAPDYWELVSKESAASLSAFETRPETTTQIDAGLLIRRGQVSGSVAMFGNDISNFILIQSGVTKPATPMGGSNAMTGSQTGGMTGGTMPAPATRQATTTRNIDASSWGGEASVAWIVTSGLTLDSSIAYVRGSNDTDHRPLAQLPPLESRVGLTYATDRWSAGALTRLVAAQTRYALNQGNIVGQDLGPTASFAVFSLNGGWRLARFARVSAGVDNVFDTTYAEFISRGGADVPGFTTTQRVNEPGRMVWIKLDLRN